MKYIPKRRMNSWCQIVIGVAMLGCSGLGAFICLGYKIGFGKALAANVLGILIAVWVIAGAVLLGRGLNKM